MNTKAIIRPISPKDNAVVSGIIKKVMTEFHCVGSGYSIEDPEVDDMYTAYANTKSAFYVIEQAGVVMGCGGFGPLAGETSDICELKKMYFLDALRGQGMGYRLVQVCIENAKAMGYQQMYLETVDRMSAANKLYRKMGFSPLASHLGATGHSGCDAFYIMNL